MWQELDAIDSYSDSDSENEVSNYKSDHPKTKKKKIVHKFRPIWLTEYDWLEYDETTGMMTCELCKESNYRKGISDYPHF